ncbi:unnamed protein product [Enterobius vermicularis]|uniref:Lipoprotein n=1 Tax=Enterobius vermicularis TaxID=51028 RepID=A0A0N4V9I1_ENTVE|nr:unnamed protein product [Enterobius vermicularis]
MADYHRLDRIVLGKYLQPSLADGFVALTAVWGWSGSGSSVDCVTVCIARPVDWRDELLSSGGGSFLFVIAPLFDINKYRLVRSVNGDKLTNEIYWSRMPQYRQQVVWDKNRGQSTWHE